MIIYIMFDNIDDIDFSSVSPDSTHPYKTLGGCNEPSFMSKIFCPSDDKTKINATQFFLAAIENKRFGVAEFLIGFGFDPDFKCVDKNGNNIIHGLIESINKTQNGWDFLLKHIKEIPSDAVNHANKLGNTPLHDATAKHLDKLTNVLIALGAKRTPNLDGDEVVTDNTSAHPDKQKAPVFEKPKDVPKTLKKIITQFGSSSDRNFSIFGRQDTDKSLQSSNAISSDFVDHIKKKLDEFGRTDTKELKGGGTSLFDVSTSEFITNITNKIKEKHNTSNVAAEAQIKGGNKPKTQKKHAKIQGFRTMRTYSDLDSDILTGGSSSEQDKKSAESTDSASELTRAVDKQKLKFKDDAIAKIMKFLDKPDKKTADNIHNEMFANVEKAHPELSSFDISAEVLKNINEHNVKQMQQKRQNVINKTSSTTQSSSPEDKNNVKQMQQKRQNVVNKTSSTTQSSSSPEDKNNAKQMQQKRQNVINKTSSTSSTTQSSSPEDFAELS